MTKSNSVNGNGDDNEEHPKVRGSSPIERAVQHVIQVISVAAILGGFYVLQELRTSNAVIQVELQSVKSRLDDLKPLVTGNYTDAEAQRDQTIFERALEDHEDRIRTLEGR